MAKIKMNKEVSMVERRMLMESMRSLIMYLNSEEVSTISLILNTACERMIGEENKNKRQLDRLRGE